MRVFNQECLSNPIINFKYCSLVVNELCGAFESSKKCRANYSLVPLSPLLASVWLRFSCRLIRIGAEEVIQSLQNRSTALVTIIDLDLLVLVADKLLDVYPTRTSHPQHNTALVSELLIRDLRLLDLKLSSLLVLLGAHAVLCGDCRRELLQLRIGGHWVLEDVPLEVGARLWLLVDRYGLVDHVQGLGQSRDRISGQMRGFIGVKGALLAHE